MRSVLVLGPVRGVAEGLGAARELAGVGLLARVGPQVSLQVLEARVGLVAGFELKRRRGKRSIDMVFNLETRHSNFSTHN